MKIGFDLSAAVYGTGVSRYTTNLARALVELKETEQVFFGASLRQYKSLKSIAIDISGKPGSLRLLPLPPKAISLWFNHLNQPVETLIDGLDVFHSWDWYLPRSNSTAVVVTIHDVAQFKYPETAHPKILRQHQKLIERAKKYATMILTDSESSRNDLLEMFSFPSEKIKTVYPALPQESLVDIEDGEIDQLIKYLKLNKPYFLWIGTKEPRKNLSRQIKAWENYKKDYDLVLVGPEGWDTIADQTGIHKLPYVSDRELSALYRRAAVVLYVSVYEGFGFPILEAFYAKVPVVTGNISSMAEIAGEAAVLADPQSVDGITGAIKVAINHRDAYIDKGVKRLKQFNWLKTAESTLAVYRQAVAR